MKTKVRRRFKLVSFALVSLVFVVGIGIFRTSEAATEDYQYLDLFTKVLHYVKSDYVEPVDTKKLVEGAIKGMLATLDPHTVYLPPEQYREMEVDTTGQFGGLGIEITVQDGYLTVVSPIEDTPAFKAGVEPGDKIVGIEDKVKHLKKDTKGMTLNDAVDLMRGKRGTKVTIDVMRKGVDKPIPIEIKRDVIKVVGVKGGLIEPDYAWLRITSFQSKVGPDLRKKILELQKKNGRPLAGMVLDLRANPGGLLEEAVNVAGEFLPKNTPVVSTIGRDKTKKDIEYAHEDHPFTKPKLVVLVDEATASASEIVAGAIQDNKRGLIIGKTTFGKGSVQTVIDLENHSALKLTIARYYTPSGRSIQSRGIQPDIVVDRLDVAMMKKAEDGGHFLREADLPGHLLNDTNPKNPTEPELNGSPLLNGTSDDSQKKVAKSKHKMPLDDPREMIKTDYQLQQALAYLKAWNIFQASGDSTASAPRKTASADATTGG